MDIFEATKAVRQHIINSINPETLVQKTGVIAYGKGEFLHFKSENEAINLTGGNGYVFSYIYRNGQVELKPLS